MENIDILFVENEKSISDLYIALMRAITDVTFKIVSSGEEALELLKSTEFKIFILDINLGSGKLSGVDLSIEIRKQFCDAKIYVMTGHPYLFDSIDPSIAGIDKVFSKPKAVLHILDTIKNDLAI